MDKHTLLNYIGGDVSREFEMIEDETIKNIEEIRFRIGKPVLIYIKGKEYSLNNGKMLSNSPLKGYKVKQDDIKRTIQIMSNFSIYSIEDELKKGYITIAGGHRIGISGKAILECGQVKTINNISGLNVRMSHEVFNCSDKVIDYVAVPKIKHTLIISPPACGKTTLLRDLARQLSNGVEGKFKGVTVGIVDERSEIGGCFLGIPQNDVGIRTDVLDGCPKAEGMMMFLRSMSPKVIIVDEIGSEDDIYAIENIVNAGVKIICTIHGNSIQDILDKPDMLKLMERKVFERYIVLRHKDCPGVVEGVYDRDFEKIETKKIRY